MFKIKQLLWSVLILLSLCNHLYGAQPAISTDGWQTETDQSILKKMATSVARTDNALSKAILKRAVDLKKAVVPAGHVVVEAKTLEAQKKQLAETEVKLKDAESKLASSGSGGGGAGGAAAGEAEALEVIQKTLAIYEPDIYAALKIANLLAPLTGRTEPKIVEAVDRIKTLLKKQTDDANAAVVTIAAITPDDSLLKSPVDLSSDAKPELKNLKDFILMSTLLNLLGDKTNQTTIDGLKTRFVGIIGDQLEYDKFEKDFIVKVIGMPLFAGAASVLTSLTPSAPVVEKIKWQDCTRLFDFVNYDICTSHKAGTTKEDVYGLNIKGALEEKFAPSTLTDILADPKKLSNNDKLDAKYKTSFITVLEKIFEGIESGSLEYTELYKKFIVSKLDTFKGVDDLLAIVGALDDIQDFPSPLPPADLDIFKEFIVHLLLIKKPKIDPDTLNYRQKLAIADSIDKILAIPTFNFLDAIDIAMLNPKVLTQDQFVGAVKFKITSIKLLLKEPWRISDSNRQAAADLMYGVDSELAQVAAIASLMNNYFTTQDLSLDFVLKHIAYMPGLTQASCLAMIESLKLLTFKNSVAVNSQIDDLLTLLTASDIDGVKKKYPGLSDEGAAKMDEAFAKKSMVKIAPTAAVKTLDVAAQKNFIDIINPLLAKKRVTRDLVTVLSKKHTTAKKAPQDLELFALLKSDERMVANILQKIQAWIDESTNPVFYKALPNALYQMLEPYYFLSSLGKMIEHNERNVEYDPKSKAIKKINSDTIINDLFSLIAKLLRIAPGSEKDLLIYSAYEELIQQLALCVNEELFLNKFGSSTSYKTDQENFLAHKFTMLVAEQLLQFTGPEAFLYQRDWQDFVLKGIDTVDLLKDTSVDRKKKEEAATTKYNTDRVVWEAAGKKGPPPMKPAANWAPELEVGQDVDAQYASWIDVNKNYFQAIAKIIKANTKIGVKINAQWYTNLSYNEKKIDFNKVLKIIEYALVKNRYDNLQGFVRGISDDSLSITGLYVVDESLDKTKLKSTLLFYKNLKASTAFKALKNGLNGVSFDLKTFAIENVSTLEKLMNDVETEMSKVLTSPDKALVVENDDDFEDFMKIQVLRALYIAKNPKIVDLTNILSDPDFNNPARMTALEPDFSKLPAIKPGKGAGLGSVVTPSGLPLSPLKASGPKDAYDDFLAALANVNKKNVEDAIAKLTDINPPVGKEYPVMMLCRGSTLANKGTVSDLLELLKDKGLNFASVDGSGNTLLQQVIAESSSTLLKKSYLVPIVTYLINEAKIDLDNQNNNKETVLHILASGQNLVDNVKPVVISIIKQAKADIANNGGFRPLEAAVLDDNTLFIKQLLENKNKGEVPLDSDAISALASQSGSLKAGLNAATWNDVLLLLRDKFGVDITAIDPIAAAALAATTSTTKMSGATTDPFQVFLNDLAGGKYLQAKAYLESASNILGSRSLADQSKAIETLFGLEFGKKISLAQVKDILTSFKNAGIVFKAVVDVNNNNALHLLCQEDVLVDPDLRIHDIIKIIDLLCDDDISIVLAQNTLGQTPLHILVGGKFLDALKILDAFKMRQDKVVNNVEAIIKKLQSYGDAKGIIDSNGKTPLQAFVDKQVSVGIADSVVQKILKLLK